MHFSLQHINFLSPPPSCIAIVHLFPYRHMEYTGHHWRETTCNVGTHPHQDRPAQSWAIWRMEWSSQMVQWHLYTGHGDMGMNLIVHAPLCIVSLSCWWGWKFTWKNATAVLRVVLVFRDYEAMSSYLVFLPHIMYMYYTDIKITNSIARSS